MDSLDRAYATLGLRRGCSRAELKRTYRDLVRRWHPDRHAADPAGQAEATMKLRAINDAFRAVARAMSGAPGASPAAPPAPSAPSAPPSAGRYEPARPLSRREIDALVDALKSPGPVDLALDWAEVVVPIAAGFVLLLPAGRGHFPSTWVGLLGAACMALGITRGIRRGGPAARP